MELLLACCPLNSWFFLITGVSLSIIGITISFDTSCTLPILFRVFLTKPVGGPIAPDFVGALALGVLDDGAAEEDANVRRGGEDGRGAEGRGFEDLEKVRYCTNGTEPVFLIASVSSTPFNGSSAVPATPLNGSTLFPLATFCFLAGCIPGCNNDMDGGDSESGRSRIARVDSRRRAIFMDGGGGGRSGGIVGDGGVSAEFGNGTGWGWNVANWIHKHTLRT